MKVVAAYLLAQLGGNAAPSAGDITKILSAVGIDSDAEASAQLLKALEGKDLAAVLAEGQKKLASVPSGGGGGAAAAAPAAGGKAAAKEEKKEEEEEEADADMGFSLFD